MIYPLFPKWWCSIGKLSGTGCTPENFSRPYPKWPYEIQLAWPPLWFAEFTGVLLGRKLPKMWLTHFQWLRCQGVPSSKKRFLLPLARCPPHVGVSLPYDVIAVWVTVDDNGFLQKKRDARYYAPLRTQRLVGFNLNLQTKFYLTGLTGLLRYQATPSIPGNISCQRSI